MLGVDIVIKSQQSQMTKSILISIPILFIIGSAMHFIFDLTGRLPVVGAFVPVNESVWEHLKMAFYPVLAWWIIYYLKNGGARSFSFEKWIAATAAATVTSILTIIVFFYSYRGALGIESLALDIFSLFLGIGLGQLMGLHVYKYSNPGKACVLLSLIVIITLLSMFVLFTFNPPHIPLFMDGNTGLYGIF